MKVKELIAQLQGLDGDLDVILSQDGEGNRFLPLVDVSFSPDQVYNPKGWISAQEGRIDVPDYQKEGMPIPAECVPAVFLWRAG